jgi:hypothetical protein
MWNLRKEGGQQFKTMYPDIPPGVLLARKKCNDISVDLDELQRADWFWKRRPKKLVLCLRKTLGILFFYFFLGIASMYLRDQTLAIITIRSVGWVTLAATAVAVFVDIFRYAHWKWEYSSAIRRLLATATWENF